MANPFVLAAALSRIVTIKCPYCGFKKAIERKPAHHRVCPRCKRQFPDPITAKRRRARRN